MIKSFFFGGVSGILFSLLLTPLFSSAQASEPLLRNKILALVNGEIITQNDLDDAGKHTFLEQADVSLESRRVLQSLIEKTLQLQLAKQRGITAEPSEIDGMLKDRMRRLGFPSEEAFAGELARRGYPSLEAYRDELRDQITILKFIDREIRSKIVIQDQEVQDYYAAHQSEFRNPPETRISRIFFEVPKGTDPSVEAITRAKAEEALAQLKNGADFVELAKSTSQGPEALHGGDLGYFKPGDLSPEIEKETTSLPIGQISRIVSTPAGLHILQVTDRKEGTPLTDKEAQRIIEDLLFQKKYDQAYRVWFDRLRQAAYVEIFP